MSSIRSFIQRHPAPIYFVLAYVVTWGGIALGAGPEAVRRGTITTPQFILIWVFMLLGSGGVGLLLTAALEGWAGLHAVWTSMGHWAACLRWYAPLLIVPLVAGTFISALWQT